MICTCKKYCWFNLKNEVTWWPQNFKFIEMNKLSYYNGDLIIRNSKCYVIWTT